MPQKRNQPGRRVQLHRAMSKLGWGSRTMAWDWVCAGKVRVDGRVVTDPLTWVDLETQQITCSGEEAAPVASVTIALHKPRGIVTTRQDERGRQTVYDLLPKGLPWIFPVGRLDADSEGLLILTNDRALSVRLTEPAHRIPKTYHVVVRGAPSPEALELLRQGVELDDGPTRPALVRVLEERPAETVLEMVLAEGRNRQVRKMTAYIGHPTLRLLRVAVGRLALFDLGIMPGEWLELNEGEVEAVFDD